MFCQHCGRQLDDNDKFCTSCGTQTPSATEPTSVYYTPEPSAPPAEEASAAWWWLGFVEPLIGLLLFFSLKKLLPAASRKVGKGALVGAIVGVVLSMVMSMFGMLIQGIGQGLFDSFGSGYYEEFFEDPDNPFGFYDHLSFDSEQLL